MLPSGAWGKRKPRGQRLGWVRSDARGAMWARQEGRHHPDPHTVIHCPSSSSSSVSCSGKACLRVPVPSAPGSHRHFSLPSFPLAPASCCLRLPAPGFRAASSGVPSPCACAWSSWGGSPARPGYCALPDLRSFSAPRPLSVSICPLRSAPTHVCVPLLDSSWTFSPLGLFF